MLNYKRLYDFEQDFLVETAVFQGYARGFIQCDMSVVGRFYDSCYAVFTIFSFPLALVQFAFLPLMSCKYPNSVDSYSKYLKDNFLLSVNPVPGNYRYIIHRVFKFLGGRVWKHH